MRLWIILFLGLAIWLMLVSTGNADNVDIIVEAIGKIENSEKYPYGIKSIDTGGNKEVARKICRNTVLNNMRRFKKQSKYNDYFEFLGSRYCPVQGDKTGLNKNWVKNIRAVLGKNFVNEFNKGL